MPWNMIGHEWAIQILQSHIQKGTLKHAYLITGPDSIGKRTLAMRFVQSLYCQNPPAQGENCGDCRPCKLIPAGVHPDLHVVKAEEHDRALKVDQIRELQKKIHLAPYESERRVALLLGFHQATEQAANALLKTLEEPPSKVVLILTAISIESLLPTIVSRCEVIPLRPVPAQQLEPALIPRSGSDVKARLLTSLSGGRPGWALAMLEDPDQLERRSAWLDELGALLGRNRAGRFAYVEQWDGQLRRQFDHLDDRRDECIEVLECWLSYWRDLMLVAHQSPKGLNNLDRINELQKLAQKLSIPAIISTVQDIQHTMDAIAANANIRLALEALVIKLPPPNL